jgi:hypothetical protein
MSSVQSTASRPRQNRVLSTILLAVGAAVLAAGIVVLVIKLTDKGSSTAPQQAATPSHAAKPNVAPPPPALPHVKYSQLPAKLHATVKKFVMTAVVRRNTGESYKITTPGLRQGMSAKAWGKGDIPIQYFPVYKFGKASFVVRDRTPNEVLVRMGLMATPKSGLHATQFDIGLHKFGSGRSVHWKVDYWMPFFAPAEPAQSNGPGGA